MGDFLDSKEWWVGLALVNASLALGLWSVTNAVLSVFCGIYLLYRHNNPTNKKTQEEDNYE